MDQEVHNGARVSPLQSEIYLTLQTKHAQALVRGRDVPDKPLIVGLVSFADRLRLIWMGSQQNDPYADWWLIKIEDSISTATTSIQTTQKILAEMLKGSSAIRIGPAACRDPFRLELRFATPYAFRAANVLAEFDMLVRDTLTARHVGLISSDKSHDLIFKQTHKIRSIFNLPFLYRFLSIDRNRPHSWVGVQKRAETLMGILPPDVKEGRRRAALAPKIRALSELDIPAIGDPTLDPKEVFGS